MAAVPISPRPGGCAFAEDPALTAADAAILWRADIDPGVLVAEAHNVGDGTDSTALLEDRGALRTIVVADKMGEHVAISDGFRRIRLDIVRGTVRAGPVSLCFLIEGLRTFDRQIETLRRFAGYARHGRLLRSLFPPDARIARWTMALRVYDGLAAGATHREIAEQLFGAERMAIDWRGDSDALQSRVRRFATLAKKLGRGGYRLILSQP